MKWISIVLFLLGTLTLNAQEARLAQQYYQRGDYSKAAILFERLFEEDKSNFFFFDRYFECLLQLERWDESEKALKKQLRRDPDNVNLFLLYGKWYEQQYEDEKANEEFQKAIDRMPRDHYQINQLAISFMNMGKHDLAIETLQRGSEILNDEYVFSFNLAELYRRKGEKEAMVTQYLNSLEENPGRMEHLKVTFQRYFSDEEFEELQRQLYMRIQENDRDVFYPELLSWTFVQTKDYASALRQVKALDRRMRENGGRVFQLALDAFNDGDYDTAIEGFDYIVERKGPSSTFYIDAKRESLRARREKLVEGYDYTIDELVELEGLYDSFLNEFGRFSRTAGIVLEYAKLEAIYLNKLPEAIALLEEMIDFPGLNERLQAYGKLDLADYYLMNGDRWESTLLYSQVDKDFKEDLLGSEARFRNARLSYYMGDFQWAQSQFDILKASTSKLIANDALDLSVFIMDNLTLDTSSAALQLYADADLLVFQNRFEEAFGKMDSLLENFSGHSLEDDVLYLKARIHKKKREWKEAVAVLEKIVSSYPEEIRADNSLFEWAEITEKYLNDPEQAKVLYEKLFLEYDSSTFAVEARKRYRRLRGDDV